MAMWQVTEIRFTERKPTPNELERLNRALKSIDYDAPPLTEDGMPNREWRSPVYPIETILAYFVRQGFPCVGFQSTMYEYYEMPCTPEKFIEGKEIPNLSDVNEWDEAYWNNVSAERQQLEAKMGIHCKISNSLSKTVLDLQSVCGLISQDGDKPAEQSLIKALTVLCELRDTYINKHSNTVSTLREIEHGTTD